MDNINFGIGRVKMINVHCLNNIASCGLNLFGADYNTESSYEDAEAVLVRSAKMQKKGRKTIRKSLKFKEQA